MTVLLYVSFYLIIKLVIANNKYPYSFIVEYIPIRFGNSNPQYRAQRKAVFDFMDGKCSEEYIRKIIEEIDCIVGDHPEDWILCFIPAATEKRTLTRYTPLKEEIKKRSNIVVSLTAITCWRDGEIRHISPVSANIQFHNIYQVNEYYGKKVILMDDLIASGKTFKTVAETLYSTGAKEVHGLIFGKTVHPTKENLTQKETSTKIDGIVLTSELIEAGMSAKGGYNAVQLKALGISWPPPKGWKTSIIGTTIDYKNYETFINHKKFLFH